MSLIDLIQFALGKSVVVEILSEEIISNFSLKSTAVSTDKDCERLVSVTVPFSKVRKVENYLKPGAVSFRTNQGKFVLEALWKLGDLPESTIYYLYLKKR